LISYCSRMFMKQIFVSTQESVAAKFIKVWGIFSFFLTDCVLWGWLELTHGNTVRCPLYLPLFALLIFLGWWGFPSVLGSFSQVSLLLMFSAMFHVTGVLDG
jgi:hypothetical protein